MLRGKPLWPRRIEVLLAQISLFIAKTTGNKEIELADTDLFGPQFDEAPPGIEEAAVALSALAGGTGIVRLNSSPNQEGA